MCCITLENLKIRILRSHARKTCFKCVKHVSNVTFYHLSNRQKMPNVMKISVKINTMQNFNILLLVLNKLKALQLSKVGLSTIKHQHSKKLTRWIEAT